MAEAIPRRAALVGTAAAFTVTACGSEDGGGTDNPTTTTTTAAPETGQAGGESLGPATDIEVGGGKVFKDQQVVVTQATEGQFKAFSAICTHQKCVVEGVSDGTINCECHGSKFKVADGSVANGPASSPLPSRPVRVSDDGDLLLGS